MYNIFFAVCDKSKISNNKSINDKKIGVYNLKMKSYFDILSIIKLAKIIKKNNIEIIHTRLIRADILGMIMGRLFNIPIILNITSDINYHFSYYHSTLAGLIYKSLYKFIFNRCKKIIVVANSNSSQDSFYDITKTNDIKVIKNSINPINNQKINNLEDFIIGYIGRVEKNKNLMQLVYAFKKVNAIFPKTKLHIVGDGKYLNIIENEIKKIKLQSSVKLLGFKKDIIYQLNLMDLFVFPSISEGMPNSILEAMSVGLPTIGFNVSGVRDLIVNEFNGLLLNNISIESLSESILHLIRDDSLRKRLGQNAQLSIKRDHSVKSMVRSFEEQYNNLLLI